MFTKCNDQNEVLTIGLDLREEINGKFTVQEMEAKIETGTKRFQKLVEKTFNKCDHPVIEITSKGTLDTGNSPSRKTKRKLVKNIQIQDGDNQISTSKEIII